MHPPATSSQASSFNFRLTSKTCILTVIIAFVLFAFSSSFADTFSFTFLSHCKLLTPDRIGSELKKKNENVLNKITRCYHLIHTQFRQSGREKRIPRQKKRKQFTNSSEVKTQESWRRTTQQKKNWRKEKHEKWK